MESTASAIHVQRVTRGFLCRLRCERTKQLRVWSETILRTKLTYLMATRLFRKRLERSRTEHGISETFSRSWDLLRVDLLGITHTGLYCLCHVCRVVNALRRISTMPRSRPSITTICYKWKVNAGNEMLRSETNGYYFAALLRPRYCLLPRCSRFDFFPEHRIGGLIVSGSETGHSTLPPLPRWYMTFHPFCRNLQWRLV